MSAQRIVMHRLQELVRLHRLGTGAREVARLLGMSPNTEREYRQALTKLDLLEGPVDELPDLSVLKAALPQRLPPQQVSDAEAWADEVKRLLKKKDVGPRAIYDHLRINKPDFDVSYYSVKRYCARIQAADGVRPEDVAIPVDTGPGEVAQVDFGYVGKLYDPDAASLRKAWVFVMVLGFSRHQYAQVVFDQKEETWQRLHAQAFAYFGGVPGTVVPDNLKAAVVRMAFGHVTDDGIQRGYREVARHYGFMIDPTPPRDPEKKGKVEAGVKYVCKNFFAPREEGEDITAVNAALKTWLTDVAGQRDHGTTRLRPLEVFMAEEKASLKPLPPLGWSPVMWKQAKIHTDCHLLVENRPYSAPWEHVGKTAWVKVTAGAVTIYVDDVRVRTHARKGPGTRTTNEADLPADRANYRHRGRGFWEGKARIIGTDVAAWVADMFDHAAELSPLRAVQQVVTLLETYPTNRANAACRRAMRFDIRNYREIKRILVEAIDFEALPDRLPMDLPSPAPASAPPRFARPISQMLAHVQKVAHDTH